MPEQTSKKIPKKIGKKSNQQMKKTSPYANINWEKAKLIFEKSSYQEKSRKSPYPSAKEILYLLAKVGAVGMMFAFPGAAPALGSLILESNSYDRWHTKHVISRLAKQKFVKIKEDEDGCVTVTITQEGMVRALTYKLETMRLVKPKTWDGKWRVIIFDIPEKWKRAREILRMRLQQLGLYKLQESVYISPYKCFAEIEFLRELYGIAFTVRYLLVEKVEDDAWLRQHFDLN